MTNRIERVLILSPHPDDGELSAGGTIAKLVEEEKEMFYIAFSSCEKSVKECDPKNILQKECLQATKELNIPSENVIILNFEVREFPYLRQKILDALIKIGKEIHPDLIITPSSFDMHQDHHTVYEESLRAFKKASSIWGMEHPWNNISFRTDIFVNLTETHIAKKVKALQCYSSQSYRDYFNDDYIKANALTRGMNIGKEYAEVFECIRILM